ncbi:MAG TPA: hypothetical protein VLL48_01450 [Longimicrobiales bacterium]|nr:hypothetical protein [Longimicrobiales bacterium]
MMRPRPLCLAAVLLSGTLPAPVAGQSGPWWEVGVEGGALRFTCDICATERDVGRSYHVAAGLWAPSRLAVGLEAGWWRHRDDDIQERVYRLGVVGRVHPRPENGLHALAGVGWVGYRAGDFTYDGLKLSLGVGWDLPLADRLVVGNRLTLDAASFGTLFNGDERVVGDVSVSLVRFTVLVGYR